MADNHLTCAVIGCGRISSQHIEGFLRAENTSIAALCDGNVERARSLATTYNLQGTKIYSDYRVLFSEIHPNIVSVAVPDGEHPAVVARAVDAGAHVLCEKPLALSSAEAGSMVRKIGQRELQNGVRMPYRFSAAYRFIHRWIREGNLGTPFHIRAHLSVGRLSDPSVPIEWRMRKETGGFGALADLGSHMIDLSYYLLPEWTGEVTRASGVSKIFHPERLDPSSGTMARVTAPDAVACTVSFASGCLFNLEVSRVSPGDHFLQIDGSEGSARCDGTSVWTYKREHSDHQRPQAQFDQVAQDALRSYEEPGLFEEFVRCCRVPVIRFSPDFAEGRRVVDTAALIYANLAKEVGD
ncbi:MAG TPA: Gfo/Idh/MocA family oxidoreductase [Spirochaetia bacterium]|nr:Gfo/Idh/MocA family oxidoreductase [Spirochaetia bacterium]